MVENGKIAQQTACLQVAQSMCAAIRTAPKTQGKDQIECCIVSGADLITLACRMDAIGKDRQMSFMNRDANNVRASDALILVGVRDITHGLDEVCGYCGHNNCIECAASPSKCYFSAIDVGIAIGSAVSLAADNRIDNRVLFSAGRASMDLEFLKKGTGQVLAIALSVTGKSPYFDRK